MISDIYKNGLKTKRKTELYKPKDEDLVTASSEVLDKYEGKQIWLQPEIKMKKIVWFQILFMKFVSSRLRVCAIRRTIW